MTEKKLWDDVYSASVADSEKIRASVLEKAHREQNMEKNMTENNNSTRKNSAARRVHIWRRSFAGAAAACLAFFALVNVSPTFAEAVEKVPVLSAAARMITIREWNYQDDATDITGQQPAVEDGDLASSVNPRIEEKLTELDEAAKADAAEYRENWLAMGNKEENFVPIKYDFDYETYYSSDAALSFLIREKKTITTNTADTYTTLFYYNVDAQTGDDLTLEGLLGSDWKKIVADGLDAGVRATGDERKIGYYEEFWVNKNVPIDDTQKFYITDDGHIAIVFDEGWIAPVEDGPQTYVLDATVS